MSRIVFLIDGFNLYHALDDKGPSHPSYNRYKWISLTKLVSCYVTKKDTIEGIYYFTTLASWSAAKVARHQAFIRVQEIEGVRVVYGEFKRKKIHCRLCNGDFWTHEEKQTDVNIALKLFQLAATDAFDKAIIISGDTDLLPSVRAVKATYPAKQIGVVIPIARVSEDFKKSVDFHYKMKEKHLQSSRMNDIITLPDGSTLSCPPNWK
jgi:uncharacterized LabA/DUF88 family protein